MDDTFIFLQEFIENNSVLPSFFFLTSVLLIKWLCISLFFNLIYLIIVLAKRTRLIQANLKAYYYCWYALLFSFILANLGFDDYLTGIVFQMFYTGKPYASYAYLITCILSALWLLIAVCKIGIHFTMNRKIRKKLKMAKCFKDNEGLVVKASEALSLKKEIKAVVTGFIDTPVSYGIRTKYVLIPGNYKEKYESDELYLVLLHELSHIKNGDTIKFRLINFLTCLMWFNPVMPAICKHFRQDTEILCDNRVVGVKLGAGESYGHLLIKSCSGKTGAIGYGFSDSYNMVKDRINALYRYKPLKSHRTAAVSFAVIVFMAANSAIHFASASSLNLNHDFNSVFEISMNSPDYMDYEYINSEIGSTVYTIENDTIIIDKSALHKLFESFSNSGYEIIVISSINFFYKTNQYVLTNGNKYRFNVDDVSDKNEAERYFCAKLSKRHPIEHLLLSLANKL